MCTELRNLIANVDEGLFETNNSAIYDKAFLKEFYEEVSYSYDEEDLEDNLHRLLGELKNLLEEEDVVEYMNFDADEYAANYPSNYEKENGLIDPDELERIQQMGIDEAGEQDYILRLDADAHLSDIEERIPTLQEML